MGRKAVREATKWQKNKVVKRFKPEKYSNRFVYRGCKMVVGVLVFGAA